MRWFIQISIYLHMRNFTGIYFDYTYYIIKNGKLFMMQNILFVMATGSWKRFWIFFKCHFSVLCLYGWWLKEQTGLTVKLDLHCSWRQLESYHQQQGGPWRTAHTVPVPQPKAPGTWSNHTHRQSMWFQRKRMLCYNCYKKDMFIQKSGNFQK